jgi:hypothetical protein
MTTLTEDQKTILNQAFGISLDDIGESNYSVYHQTNYLGGPLNIYVDGFGQIFSTERSRRLTCLVIHNGNPIIKEENCLLIDGYESTGDLNVSQT